MIIQRIFLRFSLILLLSLGFTAPAWATPAPAELGQVVQEIEQLDQMRSQLASTLEDRTEPPTVETFKEVCKPVGMRAKQLNETHPWQVKQIASRYRNPAHAPDTDTARAALTTFETHPDLISFVQTETINGEPGTRYYRRINVEATCLACHGAKASRPDFVKNNYPQDLAYDFQAGDLRGMYAVFVPDAKAALAEMSN
ncbi:DUF3365 domain-containing protein [Spirulina major CS-329]|jgi:hypothetical protein|uniref:Tll0287-like domain-containing protein n=1 Tax=Spirulina TaxID=1154 RepID=UPI00232FC7F1|nr:MULTISPECIES: DUF3365 domain-containing protein [Spirulina]MDB9497019.1 DUF3365 domain-containing protein [Spirulina subsalsa CS-330]MDB9505367.1 DUF3365 domain-containing protein [Spirulina major CS-329]